jgi:hypothetical protein
MFLNSSSFNKCFQPFIVAVQKIYPLLKYVTSFLLLLTLFIFLNT